MPRMPHEMPPHERGHAYERLPHEEIFERMDRMEEILRRIEEKIK